MNEKNKNQKIANAEFLARRIKRLQENRAALAILSSLGINEKIQKQFLLGLSELYTDSQQIVHDKALVAPVINISGQASSRSIYFNLSGVTVNPAAENFWSRGEAQTYFTAPYKKQRSVIVCSDLLDLWLLDQVIDSSNQKSKVLLIASSNRELFPTEWYDSSFWSGFENIYLAYPNNIEGDKNASKIASIAGNRVKSVHLPEKFGSTWREFCQTNKSAFENLQQIFAESRLIDPNIDSGSNFLSQGQFGYQPVDIAGTYHNGHLYYPVRIVTEVKEEYRDEQGHPASQLVARTEVVLIKSDRMIEKAVEAPAPRGTPLDERIIKLNDGTIIESRPKASIYSTWSWNSIQEFHNGKSKTRVLGKILADVKDFLKQTIWLPFDHDYDLLTLLVPVTFAQAVFRSVPLVLVTGAPGSGKSALGRAMIRICANAALVGQTSAAAVARLIDETKGFVVFDDLESIGRRRGRDAPQFSELVQALKLSYNRETSWKNWTDVSRGMSVKRLNFYGVKMINNTTGADPILGSRSLKIYTRKIPSSHQFFLKASEDWDPVALEKLRNELHTWTFENVSSIDQTYQHLSPIASDRNAEITAPLKVFAELSGSSELTSGLAQALEFQIQTVEQKVDPVKLLEQAVKRLALSGYTEVSPTHILLEMKSLLGSKPFLIQQEVAGWENPGWVGRQLRTQNFVAVNSQPTREFLYGKYLRLYKLEKSFLKTLPRSSFSKTIQIEQKGLDFCTGCEGCAYQNYGCPIMPQRLRRENNLEMKT